MGQEQSYVGHANSHRSRFTEKYEDPIQYRRDFNNRTQYRPPSNDYHDPGDYKRHRARRSAESFKSDNSSTESSGYRSGSNSASDRSSTSDYYSLYKNDHYRDINKEIYKPVKLSKERQYKFLDSEKEFESAGKGANINSYLSESEKTILKGGQTKKSGIRNYTPKILTEDDPRKKLEDWI